MPRICGANGCVFIPNNPSRAAAPTNAVLGYDAMGQPVYAGQEGRAIVSQSPNNPAPQPPPPAPIRLGPYTQFIGNVPNPIQASIDFNRQVHPETLGDRIGNAISDAGNALGQPFSMGGSDNGGGYGSAGTSGQYRFQPRFPGDLQKQYETLYGNAINRLNQRFSPGAEGGINPILNQARTEFNTRTIPGIAEAFTALPGSGGQRSSAFQGALGAAGAGLNENLAALQGQYDLEQQGQMMRLLGMSPYENVYEAGTPGTQGSQGGQIIPALAEAAVAGTLGYFKGGPQQAAVDAGSSLFDRWRNSRNVQPATQNNYLRNVQPVGQMQQGSFSQLAPEQQAILNNISRGAAPGNNLTPQQVQQLQSISGGVNAGDDFARTFKQPQAQRITFPRTPQQQAKYAGFNKAGVL